MTPTEWFAIIKTEVDPCRILLVFGLELVLTRLAVPARENKRDQLVVLPKLR